MPWNKRKPLIKIKMDIRSFNFLLEILSIHSEKEDDMDITVKASKLKEELLRYSIPFKNEENKILINIRFYPDEAEDLIYILFNSIDEFEVSTDYYKVLLKVRESLIKKLNE